MEQNESLSCLHYILQNGFIRLENLPQKKMVFHGIRRSITHQELQISTMASTSEFPYQA